MSYELSLPEVPASSQSILDIGCGDGASLADVARRVPVVAGVDVNGEMIAKARIRIPRGDFRLAPGEQLPFPDQSFDCVISRVALPYMNIPRALAEAYRVLRPGGHLWAKLHSARFALDELGRAVGNMRVKATANSLYVLSNGIWFHCTGRLFRMASRMESFQTARSISMSLWHAGFHNLSISSGTSFIARAQKSQ